MGNPPTRSRLTVPSLSRLTPTSASEVDNDDDHHEPMHRQAIKWFGRFRSYDSLLRPMAETKAMATWMRWRRRFYRFLSCKRHRHKETPSFQYRIPPREEEGSTLSHWSWLVEQAFVQGSRFLNTTTVPVLFLIVFVLYFVLIALFAIFIHLIARAYFSGRGVDCIAGYRYTLNSENTFAYDFLRSFDLSWTTYSTVGYGTVSVPAEDTCRGLRYFLAFEAFIGILFAGFCGATFFLKICRLHTRAYATFSSCMCLQFGNGVSDVDLCIPRSSLPTKVASVIGMTRSEDEEESDDGTVRHVSLDTSPFPVLVFRLINDRASMGQIVDASIKCMVVSVTVRGENDDEMTASDSERVEFNDEQVNHGFGSSRRPSPVKKQTYCKLRVSPTVNPYFAHGVWYVRHVMNHKSALLKANVRRSIAEIGGWPSDIDTYDKVRSSMADEVQGIIVTFNGISNLTADRVFKTVTYKPEDIYIGWRFARMHYMNESKYDVCVDASLLHDIIPQDGGGCEPLGTANDE